MVHALLSPARLLLGTLGLVVVLAACQPTNPEPEELCQAGTNGADPVIVVAGTFSPQIYNEVFTGARLAADGYTHCVFELKGDPDLGDIPGTASIEVSADALAVFVADVLAWSGADQVDLVGHSQGALVARQYTKFDGGAPFVDTLVSLGGPHHGTELASLAELFTDTVLAPFGLPCEAVAPCHEMKVGSDLVAALNQGDPTPGDVNYFGFVTDFDAVVFRLDTGAETGFIDGDAINRRVQQECPLRLVGHAGLMLDEVAYEMTRDALRGDPIDVPVLKCALPSFPG